MGVQIATGALLVALTWAVVVLLNIAYGRWSAVLVGGSSSPDARWRAGLWWGLAWLTVVVVALNLVVPLGSGSAAALVLALGGALALMSVAARRMGMPRWRRPGRWTGVFFGSAALAVAYLAVKVLGPVTNYDSGLYHLGAAKYAHEFATIPGLATLYFPFGYANAQFPLAALLGNGPWDGVGYRLLNGAIMVLALVELGSRLLNRRWTWGTCTLLLGMGAVLVPTVAMADGIVTSPTSDTSVMILTIVSSAYLADALSRRRGFALNAGVAVVLAALTVAMRPTMGVFALVTVIVVAVVTWRQRAGSHSAAVPEGHVAWILPALVALLLALATTLRDRVLSGWLLYPLSVISFDVPWLADDATGWRDATLAAARDPLSPDGYVTAHSWGWIGPWITRLPTQWETWFVLVGLLTTVAALIWARRVTGFPHRWRMLLLLMAPSAAAVVAWFVLSPPSFRFIWGPLFSLLLLPLGGAVHALAQAGAGRATRPRARDLALMACSAAVVVVTVFSVVARNQVMSISESREWALGPIALTYAVTPIPVPDVVPVEMSTGLVLFTPIDGEQCWDNYPLCSFSMGDDIGLLGPSIQDGFARR